MAVISSYVRAARGLQSAVSPTAAALALGLALGANGARAAEPRADLVLVNGAVYTVDAARSWASAVAIRGEQIVAVGTEAEIRALAGPSTRVVDLAGRMLLPGFQDSHIHPVTGGLAQTGCVLFESKSGDEVLARVRRCVAEAKPGTSWIVGRGWELPLFPNGNPHKKWLDQIESNRPIYLVASDGHSGWANSKALELAGITAATPDPPSGRIERDPSGEPSGTLRESAKPLLTRLIPDPTADEAADGLAIAVERAHRFGITGVFEANAKRWQLEAYRKLQRAGKLGLHVEAALPADPKRGIEQVAELVALRDEDWGPDVRAGAVKLYEDGVIEAQTAALLEPYLRRDGDRGELIWSEEKLDAIAVALDRAGFQLHVHAIGDRAIRATFDAIEAAISANGPRDRRATLAHIQLFAPVDLARFRKLGAVASFQPLWAYEDSYIRDLTLPFLGPERSRWLYPIASVVRTGAIVAGGSDWSVSSMNPLEAIEVAVTRRGPDVAAGPAWIPEEQVDLATMLAAYTMGSAWAAFREKETGSIEIGKLADLVVLDRNLFDGPPTAISEAKALLTLFRGHEVWRDPGFTAGAATP